MDFQEKVKGKPFMLASLGLTYDQQIMVAIPSLFDFEDVQWLRKIQDFPTSVQQSISHILRCLTPNPHPSFHSTLLSSILPKLWPLLLLRIDPQNYLQHLTYLQSLLHLTDKHICILQYFSHKNTNKYQQFCVKHTLQYFKVRYDQIDYGMVIDGAVGEVSLQGLLAVIGWNVHREVLLREEDLFGEQQWKVSEMGGILEKVINQKSAISKLSAYMKNQSQIVRHLNKWVQPTDTNHILGILRILKIIVIIQHLYQQKSKQTPPHNEPLLKILVQSAMRCLSKLFTRNTKLKILILQWILQGKIWNNTTDSMQNMKNNLMYYMIACYQLHMGGEDAGEDGGEGRAGFVGKIKGQENKLVCQYLGKIKMKLFANTSFRTKVPKSFLSANLGLLQPQSSKEDNQVNSYLQKNGTGTGTVSLSKVPAQSHVSQGTTNTISKTTNLDKLQASVHKYTDNLQLHKIYILCLCLNHSPPARHSQQTQPQQKSTSFSPMSSPPSCPSSRNTLRALFYQIYLSLKKYQQKHHFNLLTCQILKIISTYTAHFQLGTIRQKQIMKVQLQDLQFVSNSEVNLEMLAGRLLANCGRYSLETVYQIECAQNVYDRVLAENNPKNNNRKVDKNTKYDVDQGMLGKLSPQMRLFKQNILKLIRLLTDKKQNIQYLSKLVLIAQPHITRTLYHNLLYYLSLHKPKRPNHKQSQTQKQYEHILSKLYSTFFTIQTHLYTQTGTQTQTQAQTGTGTQTHPHSQTHTHPHSQTHTHPHSQTQTQTHDILYILGSSHKILENWKKCTSRSSMGKDIGDLMAEGREQEKAAARRCFQILLASVKQEQLKLVAANFSRINFIKQSIYIMDLYNRRVFPPKPTNQEISMVYQLHCRLDNHLQILKPHIKPHPQPNSHDTTSPTLSWYSSFKYLSNKPQSTIFACLVDKRVQRICELEDVEEINNVLNQVYLCSCYYEAINSHNYQRLHSVMGKYNDRDICLSIVQSLTDIKNQLPQSKQHSQLTSIIYSQLLRFQQYQPLLSQLQSIPPQSQTPEQLRTSIILYSHLNQHQKVRLLFRSFKNIPNKYRQQLQLYNMQAGYKSFLYYPAQETIKDFDMLIRYVEEEVDGGKIGVKFTESLFQYFKFICENYEGLTLREEKLIITYLNRYLKKVYSINNHQLSKQAAFFILRFILMQSNNTSDLVQIPQIFPYESYNANILQPHKTLLISSICENQKINNFISKILIRIAQYDPKASVWWLSGLINHCRTYPKINCPIDQLDRKIEEIGVYIYQELKKKRLDLDAQLSWLSDLTDIKTELKPIPPDMVSPFSKQIILQKVISIKPLNSGKSKPSLIQLKYTTKSKKQPKTLQLIRKLNSICKTGYRTESATANFFKDSKLLDQQTTYSIIHLSKYCILVQYIQNYATLDALLINKLEEQNIKKLVLIMESTKQTKILGSMYENQGLFVNYQLHRFFNCSTGAGGGTGFVNQWWSKYNNFVRTYAHWCYLGYIVGLGDRHSNNILVTAQGKVIHIDFEYIFDSGKLLGYPQWMPFRITRGLLHQLSIIQPYGLMYSQFVKIALKFKQKNRQIWHALCHFSYMKKKNMLVAIDKRANLNGQPYQTAKTLIQTSTQGMLLRDMYIGWGPYK